MSRVCELSGVRVQSGHKVSHSQIKTKRKFLPNLQNVTFISDVLKEKVRFRAAVSAIRSVEANGGIDGYLIKSSADVLSHKAILLKKRIRSLLEKTA